MKVVHCRSCGQSVEDISSYRSSHCVTCGKVISRSHGAKYCSSECHYEFYVIRHTSGCWDWSGPKSGLGYGRMNRGEKANCNAHRFSYERDNGPIPNGMIVRHTCDNPSCTRPDHLIVGTSKDNSRDAMERGRWVPPPRLVGPVADKTNWKRGSAHYAAKLTEENVLEILTSTENGAAIGRRFGVGKTLISQIRTGKKWQHIRRP